MTFATDRAAMQAYVTSTTNLAQSYLDGLLVSANALIVEGTTELPERYDYSSVPEVNLSLPAALDQIHVSLPTAILPTPPAFDFSTITDVVTPDFSTAAPSPEFPTAPSSDLPSSPGTAPVFISPDIPAAPSVSLPSLPVLEGIIFPDVLSIEVPQFTGISPSDDLIAPTAQFQYFEAAYESTLLDPLKAKLLADLTDGGYGIETADEIALFNRARDREIEAMLSRVEDAGRMMASRGFPLPPGELSIHVDRAYQDMQDKVSSVSRDITLERSKLFVDNRQFTLREVKDLEQITLDFHTSVQERALNVARATVELGIAVFKALVDRYNARLDAYKTEAAVFAERIRAELAKAEVYKTQIDAVGVEANIQRQQTETYLAQIRGIQISVDMYRTQMEAAGIRASIERMKLEAFRSEVDAYTAQVQAKVAEFGMFRAQIEGETAKVGVFEAQVRAFNGQVTAAKLKSDVQVDKLRAETEQARVKLANYQGEIEQFKADIQRQVDSGKLEIESYRAFYDGARVVQDGDIERSRQQQEALKATVQQNIQISNLTIENAKARITGVVESLRLRTEAAKFGSQQFFAQLTAIINAVNSLSVETVSREE